MDRIWAELRRRRTTISSRRPTSRRVASRGRNVDASHVVATLASTCTGATGKTPGRCSFVTARSWGPSSSGNGGRARRARWAKCRRQHQQLPRHHAPEANDAKTMPSTTAAPIRWRIRPSSSKTATSSRAAPGAREHGHRAARGRLRGSSSTGPTRPALPPRDAQGREDHRRERAHLRGRRAGSRRPRGKACTTRPYSMRREDPVEVARRDLLRCRTCTYRPC